MAMQNSTATNTTNTSPRWMLAMLEDAQKEADKRKKSRNYDQYQTDPIGFCEQVLHNHFTDDCKQVIESVRDNPITIARSANATGKSHSAARVALWFLRSFRDAKVFVTAAPPIGNLKRILWGEIITTISHNRIEFSEFTITSSKITRNSESFLEAVTVPSSGSSAVKESKFSGKHAPHILFIVDEGDAVPDEVYKGIESCMSGGFARMLIMFNPRASTGPVYNKEINNQAKVIQLSAMSHPNVIQGKDVIPGAVTRETVVRRMNQWTRELQPGENIDTECFEVPEFLVDVTAVALDGTTYAPVPKGWRRIVDPAFSYMVLGQYPQQSESQLISREWIEAAKKRWFEKVRTRGEGFIGGACPIMGVDIAEFGVDSNVAMFRHKDFVERPKIWDGVDPLVTSDKLILLSNEKYSKDVMIDACGVGAGIPPIAARTARKAGYLNTRFHAVKVSNKPTSLIKSEIGEFYQLRDQLWWACREWLRTDPEATLPPDPYLIEELALPTYSIREDGKIKIMDKEKMRDKIRRSPDRADALCLTFYPIPRAKVITAME